MKTPQLMATMGLVLFGWVACDPTDSGTNDDEDTQDTQDTSMSVTFTTYINETCTELPPQNSVVHLDPAASCNATPDSSISNLSCYEDRITYTNHPNSNDCSATGIANELFVGVCQEFPGPARTWKLIEPETYHCLSDL